jgi:acetyl esterase/lipase
LAVRAADPHLAGLTLIYPLLNATAQTASREEFGRGYVIGVDDLVWFGSQYVVSAEDRGCPLVVDFRWRSS